MSAIAAIAPMRRVSGAGTPVVPFSTPRRMAAVATPQQMATPRRMAVSPPPQQMSLATPNTAVFSVPAPAGTTASARICVYGDSLTAGFPCYEPYAKSLVSSLSTVGVSVEVVGCGLCGMTAAEMARGLDSSQLKDQFGRTGPGLRCLLDEQGPFDLVLIMAGTNDLGVPHSSVQEVLASLQTLHRACHRVGMPSMILSVPESSVTGTSQYPEAKAKWHGINNALAAWAQDAQSPGFVDTSKLIPFDHASRARGLWDPDSLHFTALGSRELGSRLAPVVMQSLSGKKSVAPESGIMTPMPMPPKIREAPELGIMTPMPMGPMPSKIREAQRSCTPEKRSSKVIRTNHASDIHARCGLRLQTPRLNLFVPHAPISVRVACIA